MYTTNTIEQSQQHSLAQVIIIHIKTRLRIETRFRNENPDFAYNSESRVNTSSGNINPAASSRAKH